MKAIHLIRQAMEYNRDRKKTCTCYGLGKNIHQGTKRSICCATTKRDISKKYIYIVQDMYREVDKC